MDDEINFLDNEETTEEIQAKIAEVYGVDISSDFLKSLFYLTGKNQWPYERFKRILLEKVKRCGN